MFARLKVTLALQPPGLLVLQSLSEWRLALDGLSEREQMAVYTLASPHVGTQAEALLRLNPGFERFLRPHLQENAAGRFYLRDSYHRLLLLVRVRGVPARHCRPRRVLRSPLVLYRPAGLLARS